MHFSLGLDLSHVPETGGKSQILESHHFNVLSHNYYCHNFDLISLFMLTF